eukprot:scaffold30745_cov28-Tisochrysis_lutea.AAC.5
MKVLRLIDAHKSITPFQKAGSIVSHNLTSHRWPTALALFVNSPSYRTNRGTHRGRCDRAR